MSETAELAEEARRAAPEGWVPAYLDSDGVWQYVEPSLVSFFRDQRGRAIRTVCVRE